MENILKEIFDIRSIKMELNCKTKEDAFTELVGAITAVHPECESALLLKAIEEREKKMSTGITEGVAIPHAFYSGIGSMAGAIGISKHGIDYGALDNKPVHIIFLLASKNADEDHLHVLNLIFKLAQSEALELMKKAKSPEEIHAILSHIH